MSNSRRDFLAVLGALGAAAACRKEEQQTAPEAKSGEPPAGTPPAFGTAPDVGPPVSTQTFSEAEKLVNVQLTDGERGQAAGNWRKSMAPLYERRIGPRKVAIENEVAPYSRWDPVIPGVEIVPHRDQFIW